MQPAAFLANLSRRAPDLRGKTQIAWKVMRRLDRRGRLHGEWQFSARDGTRFALPRQSPMAWAMAFRGAYDPELQQVVASHVEAGTVVLDIGASLGLWTMPLAHEAAAVGAHVWAIEPHPNNHAWLHRNVDLNALAETVTVHETALGDCSGIAVMDLGEASRPGGGGNSAIAVGAAATGVKVPITTLDAIAPTRRVSVIKLDVEGYEVRVLRGAAGVIARDRPVIFGEFSALWLRERGDDLVGCLDALRDADYQVFTVEQHRTKPWRPTNATTLRLLVRGEAAENLLLRPL